MSDGFHRQSLFPLLLTTLNLLNAWSLCFLLDRQLRVLALRRLGPQGPQGFESPLLPTRAIRRESLSRWLRPRLKVDQVMKGCFFPLRISVADVYCTSTWPCWPKVGQCKWTFSSKPIIQLWDFAFEFRCKIVVKRSVILKHPKWLQGPILKTFRICNYGLLWKS